MKYSSLVLGFDVIVDVKDELGQGEDELDLDSNELDLGSHELDLDSNELDLGSNGLACTKDPSSIVDKGM